MLKYYLFRLAALVLPWIPSRLGHCLAGWAGALAYRLAPGPRGAVLSNMRRVLGPQASERQMEQAAQEVFHTAARNYFDLFRLGHLQLAQLSALVQTHGRENFQAALALGRGVVVVTAHYGNFDVVGQLMAAWGYPMVIPVEVLQPPALLRLVTDLRASKGLTFVPLGPASLRAAIRALRHGQVTGLAVDRDIQGQALRLPFFGEEASMPAGAVDLARRTGAVLLPAFGARSGNGHYALHVEPAITPEWTSDEQADRRRVMGQVLDVVERYIRERPGQWIVFEPVWESALPGETKSGP